MQIVLTTLEYNRELTKDLGVTIFLKSLRKFYEGHIVCFIRNVPIEIQQELKDANVELIDKDKFEKEHEMHQLGMYIMRFFYFYIYLKDKQFDQILMIDLFDVVFQRDPFDSFNVLQIPSDKPVFCCEAQTINKCSINTKWINYTYGEDILKQIGDKPIICAGAVYCKTKEAAMKFFKIFKKEVVWTLNNIKEWHPSLVMDQGLITKLVHTNPTNGFALDYLNSSLLHAGHVPANKLSIYNEYNNDIGMDGIHKGVIWIPAIIHQWNRHEHLKAHLKNKYIDNG